MPDLREDQLAADSPSTPLMRQYHAIKQQVPNALLMFRLGDFYELFYEDAVTAARELEITLTSRNKEKGQAIPMCGVPVSRRGRLSLPAHPERLSRRDLRSDGGSPTAGKKLVKREVTRVVTPGTATESSLLRSHENNYLAAVFRNGTRAGLAHVDISTGEFRATELDAAEVNAALENLNVREVLAAGFRRRISLGFAPALEDWVFSLDYAERALREHFRLLTLDGCGLAARPAGNRGRRRDSALSARHAKIGARSSGSPDLLRSLRLDDSGCRHGSESGIAGAAVRRRKQGIDADPCAGSDFDRHGRPAAAPSSAAAVPRSSKRSTRGWTRWKRRCRPPLRAPKSASCSRAFSIWNGCSRN